MVLFSILAPLKDGMGSGDETRSTTSSSSSSSSMVPTVIQLHSGAPLKWGNEPCPAYTLLSYQAIEVTPADGDSDEGGGFFNTKKRPTVVAGMTPTARPNLGVWSCRVRSQTTVDSMLRIPVLSSTSSSRYGGYNNNHNNNTTICITIDLTDLSTVEQSVSLMHASLVRFLISKQEREQTEQREKKTKQEDEDNEDTKEQEPTDTTDATAAGTAADTTYTNPASTTTLYHLKSTSFGLAPNDAESAKKFSKIAPEESDKAVSIALMICAIFPSKQGSSTTNEAGTTTTTTTDKGSGGDEYKEKQSSALVYYHLRRYAAALNACLCFVDQEKPTSSLFFTTATSTTTTTTAAASNENPAGAEADTNQKENNEDDEDDQMQRPNQQQTIGLEQLAYAWQIMAQQKQVWKYDGSEVAVAGAITEEKEGDNKEDTAAPNDTETTTIFGPGKHNEDLIESVILRNANYSGHWDASTDSLWKALPSSSSEAETTNKNNDDTQKNEGDSLWLGQIKESLGAETTKAPKTQGTTKKKKGKDPRKSEGNKDVSNFFADLLND